MSKIVKSTKKITPEYEEKMRKLLIECIENKMKNYEIAKLANMSSANITDWIHRLGLKAYRKYEIPKPGEKFGYLVFMKTCKREDKKSTYWLCQCVCGKISSFSPRLIIKQRAQSCGCKTGEIIANKVWCGWQEISGSYWISLKNNASKRNLDFLIDQEYAWNIFLKQNKKCALTNIDLTFPPKGKYNHNKTEQTASLDRIDSKMGYIKDNVQWIHKDINKIKGNFSEELFLQYIKLIYENKKLDKVFGRYYNAI